MTGAFQARWMCLDRSEGSVVLARQLHVVLMLDTAVSSAPATEADRLLGWGAWLQLKPERLKVPACTRSSLQVPPCEPAATLLSIVYQKSWTLRIVSSPFFSTMSNCCRRELLAHG